MVDEGSSTTRGGLEAADHVRDAERLAVLRELLGRVRERSGGTSEPDEGTEPLIERERERERGRPSDRGRRDPLEQAILLPPVHLDEEDRWSTILAADPLFSDPPPRSLTALATAYDAIADIASVEPPLPSGEAEVPALEEEVAYAEDRRDPEQLPTLGLTIDARRSPDPFADLPPAELEPPPRSAPAGELRAPSVFEDSVARALERLDDASILTSAGSELRRRGNLLSPHAKRRDDASRVLRGRTPRGGTQAVPADTADATSQSDAAPPDLGAAERSTAEGVTELPELEPPSREVANEVELASVPPRPRSWALPVLAGGCVLVGVVVALLLLRGRRGGEDAAITSTTTAAQTNSAARGPLTAEPPRTATTAGTSAAPRATPSAVVSAPTSAPPTEGVEPPIAEPRTNGLLRVDSGEAGRVFVQGIDVGPTGAYIELGCGMKFVRVAHERPPPPGQSFPHWVGEPKSVMVPCGRAQRVELTPRQQR